MLCEWHWDVLNRRKGVDRYPKAALITSFPAPGKTADDSSPLLCHGPSHLIRDGHLRFTFDITRMLDSRSADDPCLLHIGQAREKSSEPCDRYVHRLSSLVPACRYEKRLFIGYFCISGTGPVDQDLQLGVHVVEIDRGCHHQDVRSDHFLQDLGHIIVLCAGSAIPLAGKASQAEVDILLLQTYFFDLVPGVLCADHKPVAQHIGVSVFSGTGR